MTSSSHLVGSQGSSGDWPGDHRTLPALLSSALAGLLVEMLEESSEGLGEAEPMVGRRGDEEGMVDA